MVELRRHRRLRGGRADRADVHRHHARLASADDARGGSTFTTPTVVHFGAVLLASAILTAPWHTLRPAAIGFALVGAAGTVFALQVLLRTRSLTRYEPDAEDWIWYAILPLCAYLVLLLGALLLFAIPATALFLIAGAALLLIFIGIHNAWDVVTYVGLDRPETPDD